MEPGPSRAEQQEMAWWNETMVATGSSANSAVISNATAFLDSMANQNGTDASPGYYSDFGWGGKDWLALFFMTFGKSTSHQNIDHQLKPFPFVLVKTQVGSYCSLPPLGSGELKGGRCRSGPLRALKHR